MLCCGERRRERCARVAYLMLTHVNLLLMLFSGAALATAARLKWDPSAYIPLREALPLEYRAACALLPAAALALAALAHAALAAQAAQACRRPVLYTYAGLMLALLLAEVGAALWVTSRVLAFLQSPAAARVAELMEVREHLVAALQVLARWYPLPEKINALIAEAMEDGPRNGYVAEGAAIVLLVLQPAAVLLALVAAAASRRPPRHARASLATLATDASHPAYDRAYDRTRYNYYSDADNAGAMEKAPLRTAFKNGRLVIL